MGLQKGLPFLGEHVTYEDMEPEAESMSRTNQVLFGILVFVILFLVVVV